ncbi:VOC family protein [Pontiella sulfatireligans]|uniref:Glutathione transferase FosA n=1 Tax=Pontiella sulfatireligans TaxID=2750658 RepID=A0A6C2UNJ7_9BACT|nr:VOC family protein [Pontiella sulfatireligans]VGO21758.1 Glutathione transferase FosA [Pontiella sulfatireligans]
MNDFIKGICHFGLSVSDLDESVRFYSEVLGLAMSERREKDAFFQIGTDDVLALIQYPDGAARFDAEMRPQHWGKAFTHFGFAADSAKTVFEFQEHLKAQGVKIVKEAYERWDGASLYFLDPNGYTLEYIYFDPKGGER